MIMFMKMKYKKQLKNFHLLNGLKIGNIILETKNIKMN